MMRGRIRAGDRARGRPTPAGGLIGRLTRALVARGSGVPRHSIRRGSSYRPRLHALLGLCSAALLVVTWAGGSGGVSATPLAFKKDTALTVMTNPTILEGLTAKSASGSNSIASWYTYYHKIWAKDFPNLKITEVNVPDEQTEITKTLLGENAGNPPDLIGLHETLPEMVQRGALMNLTPFFKKAGIKPSDFYGPMAKFARYGGKWYAMPGASNPTSADLLVVPKYLTAAGLDPNKLPRTWAGLLQASEKVTKFGPGHKLERIGEPVEAGSWNMIDQFCDGQVVWNSKTGYQANAPCIKRFFNYEKKLTDFYGGWQNYEKFINGNPGPWSCAKNDYYATGKILLPIDAYWTGGQFDNCYNLNWQLSPGPTASGTPAGDAGMEQVAWMLAIPKGAKHPQAAFDFWLATIYQNGYLDGPTTNGYVRSSVTSKWNQYYIQAEAAKRQKAGYPGNPMGPALKMMAGETAHSKVSYPRGAFTEQYITIMTDAWNNIAFHKMSVSQALSNAQKQIDSQEKSVPGAINVTGANG